MADGISAGECQAMIDAEMDKLAGPLEAIAAVLALLRDDIQALKIRGDTESLGIVTRRSKTLSSCGMDAVEVALAEYQE